jgi:WD40 repeat protein
VIKVRGGGEAGAFATATTAGGKPFGVGSLAVAPDGRTLLAAGSSGEVLLFDRATRQLVQRLDTGADQVNGAGFSPDGRLVAAIDNVNRLHLWSVPDRQPQATLWLQHEPGRVPSDALGRLGPLRSLAWLPDSRRIAIAAQSGVVVVVTLPPEPAPAR